VGGADYELPITDEWGRALIGEAGLFLFGITSYTICLSENLSAGNLAFSKN
jgi:hypothetical protein